VTGEAEVELGELVGSVDVPPSHCELLADATRLDHADAGDQATNGGFGVGRLHPVHWRAGVDGERGVERLLVAVQAGEIAQPLLVPPVVALEFAGFGECPDLDGLGHSGS